MLGRRDGSGRDVRAVAGAADRLGAFAGGRAVALAAGESIRNFRVWVMVVVYLVLLSIALLCLQFV